MNRFCFGFIASPRVRPSRRDTQQFVMPQLAGADRQDRTRIVDCCSARDDPYGSQKIDGEAALFAYKLIVAVSSAGSANGDAAATLSAARDNSNADFVQ